MDEILINRVVLDISGEDAGKFLQNLLTNDVITNDYCYSYMLNNQGRYLFDFFILKTSPQTFLIDIDQALSSQFLDKLKMYRLRAKVEYTDLSDKYIVVYSTAIPKFLTIASNQDPRYDKLGVRSIVDKTLTLPLLSQTDLYFNDKYNFAIPDGDIDLIQAKSIPIEYGAEELKAISYSKGCYIGQEVISRTKYQGVVRKKIFKVYAEINLSNIFIPSTSNEIIINGEKIGILCSSYKNQGIALIREEKYFAIANEPIIINNIEIKLSIPEWR